MKWGFGWDLGPFEVWDALGLDYALNRMKEEGKAVPDWVSVMAAKGIKSFYSYDNGKKICYDKSKESYLALQVAENNMSFEQLKQQNNLIRKNWSASIIDLGDGVAGIEYHSALKKDLNPIDGSILETIDWALDWVSDNNYKGLVISGEGPNFCAGANLNMILAMAERKDWDSINQVTQLMQNIMQKVRFSNFPVVAAPYGLVLGGGFETIGACDRIVAASESYVGLVEVGVGLIPGAGGNLRMISNLSKKMKSAMPGAFPVVQKAFETIGFAKVGTSAEHARSYGYLTVDDIVIPNRDQILFKAKQEVISMSGDYNPPEEQRYKLPGGSGRLVIKSSIKGFLKAGKISEHDALIAEKLGYVLTGGSKGGPMSPVSEQYLLDIEREVFVSLCGEQKTLDRIGYMLKKGKPLRN
jgi:3-hydroxyacyl-CoA dehydrogenase